MGKAMKTKGWLPTVLGLGLLGGLIIWIGPAILWEQFSTVKWILPLLLAIGLLKHALRARAWKEALQSEGITVGFRRLLGVRISSQALAHLASMGPLLSDPLKPWLLRNSASVEATLPPTLVEASLYWLASLFVTLAGTLVLVTLVSHTQNFFTLLLICLLTFSLVVMLLLTRSSVIPKLVGLLHRLKLVRPGWSSALGKASEIETQMRTFRVRHLGAFGSILGFDLIVQTLTILEVWTVLYTIGMESRLYLLVAIEAAGRIVKLMSFYAPARLGIDEAGAAGSFVLLGMNPAQGLTLGIARRIQMLFWMAVGLVWLSLTGGFRQPIRTSTDADEMAATDDSLTA